MLKMLRITGVVCALFFSYNCTDPARKLTNLVNSSLPQLSNLAITCLDNGQYDINIDDYACLSKLAVTGLY